METEERIKQDMFETRASIAEKLETLEEKVTGTVDQVTTVVHDTVDTIKETVQEAKATVSAVGESVQESVKSVQESLDVSACVQAHPWSALAGSVAVGFCLGALLKGRPEARSEGEWLKALSTRSDGFSARRDEGRQVALPSPEPSMWAPEIDKLKGLALGVLFGAAREMIASALPEPMEQQIKEVIDNVTKKAGGEPMPSSAFAGLLQPRPVGARGASPQKEWRRAVPVEIGGEA